MLLLRERADPAKKKIGWIRDRDKSDERGLTMFSLPLEERDRRWRNIRSEMQNRGLDCIIDWGSHSLFRDVNGNLQYLTNTAAEGYLIFPVEAEPTLFTFEGGLDPNCWVKDWRAGHPLYSQAMSKRLKELRLDSARIGVVGLSGYHAEVGFPYVTYISLVTKFPKARFEDATDILVGARMIKSPAEIRCLEIGCEVGEKVIQAVVDVAKEGVPDYEIRATMMDTMFRNGCEPNAMILYYQGSDVLLHAGQTGAYIESPSPKPLERGDVILTEFDACYCGYKAQFNQPFIVGKPSGEWSKIVKVAAEAFNHGLNILKPGITVGELDRAFQAPIKEAGYTIANPAFHGIGLTLEEPLGSYPRQTTYNPDTSFEIVANMVLEFEPHPVTRDLKKSVHLGCPVLVTDTGCRQLAKNWKPECKVI
jgi:Xaa-Pro dipeptidase